jgi:hypothetical protein
MLSTYGYLEDPAERQNLRILHYGDYTGFTGTTLFDAFNYRSATVFSFIDMLDASQDTWLGVLKEIQNDPTYKPNLLVVAVLYKYNQNVNDGIPPNNDYVNYLNVHYSGYGSSASPNYLPFMILKNTTWADDTNCYGHHFQAGLDVGVGAQVGSWYSYIIAKNGTQYRITDKIYSPCAYNSRTASPGADPVPATDRIKFAWPMDQKQYVLRRIADALSAPTVLVCPDTADTSDGAGVARVRDGSKIRFTFSEKAVGAGDATKYRFTVGATPYTNLFSGVAGLIPDTDAAPTPDGLLASQYLTSGVKEAWEATFGSLAALNGSTIAFDPSLLVDGANNPFTLDAANTSPLRFLVDTNAATDTSVTAEVLLTDIPAAAPQRVMTLSPDAGGGASNVQFALEANRMLSVKIKTLFPGPIPPSATLSRPGSTDVILQFDNLVAVDLTATELDVYGQYHLHIDAYASGVAGISLAAADYYFAVVNPADYAAGARSNALEGWGYFPREEGLPTACLENGTDPDGDGFSVPAWTAAGSGTPSAGGGSPLSISTVASYARVYAAMFKNASGAGDPWNASAYVEAAISLTSTSTPGTSASYFDADNPATKLGLTGTGIRFRNGPYVCELALLTVLPGGQKRVGIRVFHPDPAARAFKLSPGAVDWDAASSLKVLKVQKAGSSYTVTVDGGAPILTVDEKLLPRTHYEDITASEVAFGVLENCGQTVTAVFELVRYAFYDAALEIGAGAPANALAVGFPDIYRDAADQAGSFFRSPDVTINGSASTDPSFASDTPVLTIAASVTKTAAGALAAKAVPVKVRFCAADFDDTGALGERSIQGFIDPSTFPAYGAATITPLAGAAVSTRVVNLTAGASSTAATPSPFSWTVTVNRTRRMRRLFILAYADAPLLAAPKLVAGKGAGDYFDRSMSGPNRSDPRGVIRQFLPDFYVRDHSTDDGTSTAGGSLSPDIALAIFMGDAAHTLPNPQGTAETHYPKGFAQGQPNPYNYTPSGYIEIDSTNPDPLKKIRLTDSGWSDDGATPQCYYNRMWVRVSNRGIVPGPANVQLFFLGSVLRAAFAPLNARTNAYEKIYAKVPIAPPEYVQTKFQLYDSSGSLAGLVDAVPALSGASDPAAVKNYVVAEFVWHVGATEVPASTADSHGCRAACVNLSEQAAWTSGVDSAPAIDTANSIWAANMATNNVSVRNSNIVVGQPPGAADPPVTTKALIKDDSPVTYKKLPNDFAPTFAKKKALWGIGVEAKLFPEGEVVLRVAAVIASEARPKGMTELEPEKKDKGAPKSQYRFFQLKGGARGLLEGIEPLLKDPRRPEKPEIPLPLISVFFQPRPKAKPGMYEVTVAQTADGKDVGSYRTVIAIPKAGDLRFVADERTGIIYDLERDPDAIKAIPYEKRAFFTGVGLAMQEKLRLGPSSAAQYFKGKLVNEIANIPKGFKRLPAAKTIPLFAGGFMGAIVGRVTDMKGVGIAGLEIVASDVKTGAELGLSDTDENGRYLVRVKADCKEIPIKPLGRKIQISVYKPKIKEPVFRSDQTVDDHCVAVKEIALKA